MTGIQNANVTITINGCIPQSSAFQVVQVINKNSATGGYGTTLCITHVG